MGRKMEHRKRVGTGKRKAAYEKTNGHCIYCGKYCGETAALEHVIPVSVFVWTGQDSAKANHVDNLYVSCEECNIAKGDKILENEDIRNLGGIGEEDVGVSSPSSTSTIPRSQHTAI
jgi:5-methylcytosine-specific restriction endonuclease McrA